jgi:hypothetical protein
MRVVNFAQGGHAAFVERLASCKANSIDPYHYLIALFKGLPHSHTADDYEALRPWRLNPRAA